MDQFSPINPTASLYVGDLHPSTTEMMIYEAFSQVGPVISVRVCRHRLTRRSLGYGFVNYQNRQDGDKAIKEMNGRVLGTRALYVVLAWACPGVRLQQGPCMRPRREAYMGPRYQPYRRPRQDPQIPTSAPGIDPTFGPGLIPAYEEME
uniref:RRM domain-containing protein n=1 Tax=Salarias fasciatus TaxID=181472 RepID=A0A672IDE1_SALFA